MPRSQPELTITVSVLDRLIDTEPKAPTDPAPSRARTLRQLKEGVKRDLECLLNTRRDPESPPGGPGELEGSLYCYGLPDVTSFAVRSTADRNRLLCLLESAVTTFEPRIHSVRVSMESAAGPTHALRFQIQGLLRLDPAPERISFDTVLELASGQYEIKG